jgi:hypothetical protein
MSGKKRQRAFEGNGWLGTKQPSFLGRAKARLGQGRSKKD